MIRFVLVRHGQTEWNLNERFRGRLDIALNETGLRQAEAAARSLANAGITAIYTSPLSRARQTAEAIGAALGLPVNEMDELTDFNFGAWQGLTPKEVEARYHDLHHQWFNDPANLHIPGGETLKDVRLRVLEGLGRLISAHADQTVALVTHKVICKVMLLAILDVDNSGFWRLEQDNSAISVFERHYGRYVLTLLNDTCHLREQQS
jgi:phosphoserine phosphatase